MSKPLRKFKIVWDDILRQSYGKVIETVVITLFVLLLIYTFNNQDLLLEKSKFPWLWIVTVLLALQNGLALGLLSLAIIVVYGVLLTGSFSLDVLSGGFILTVICGEFSSKFRKENERTEQDLLYMDERLSNLTRTHLILRLSHDRMEQEMLSKPWSLRDGVIHIKEMVLASKNKNEILPAGTALLELITQYGQLEVAAIYAINEGGAVGEMVASIGLPLPLEASDPLYQQAIKERELVHVAQNKISEAKSRHLVVAPMVSSAGQVWGVLVITKMPFFALNEDTLQMISLILGYYSNTVQSGKGFILSDEKMMRAVLPDCPIDFIEELARLKRIQDKQNVSTHLAVFSFRGALKHELPEQILAMKRGLDIIWVIHREGVSHLVNLMPFSSKAAKDSYMQRISNWLKERHNGSFIDFVIDVEAFELSVKDPAKYLKEITDLNE